MKKLKIIIKISSIFMIIILYTNTYADFEYHGTVDSKRSGNIITILFTKEPFILKGVEKKFSGATIKVPKKKSDFLIVNNKIIIGSVKIISAAYSSKTRNSIRVVARYRIRKYDYLPNLRVGSEIVLIRKKFRFSYDYGNPFRLRKTEYRKIIKSNIDGRIMVIVPGGKFVFGSNSGNRDQYPQQIVYVKDFYIDKYEVSNSDYDKFMKATRTKAPLSWKNGTYDADQGNYPVLVTYYEAASYARWAKKRLPNEIEWEKAARGEGYIKGYSEGRTIIYPWGNNFETGMSNNLETWLDGSINKILLKKYNLDSRGYLPVNSFNETGLSPYGIANMAGNAKEWTSSWYMPYKGNRFPNRKYGKQYKVVRGGAWYNSRKQVTVTYREPAGIPNLYEDNLAGFRCIRYPTILERK